MKSGHGSGRRGHSTGREKICPGRRREFGSNNYMKMIKSINFSGLINQRTFMRRLRNKDHQRRTGLYSKSYVSN
jgi:hypothetical protein